ncbi:hypothetical protein ACFOGJ_12055 [Marinibaculum pumilum]|uniref:Extradiol ring-cleavage dioxygenase class III enzyme subunit B domain-containing protein n=1 Tax=Marinibaculum pumilum TaxID=1766165 RepID=A0ABV7KZX8_9PROT
MPPFRGDPAFSWHRIEHLVADEFDLTTYQETAVDHGFTVPMQLLWPHYDRLCMEKVVDDPEYLLDMSILDLVRDAGAQGAEFILWLTTRGALGPRVRERHRHYHIPISNTAAGLLCLENAA